MREFLCLLGFEPWLLGFEPWSPVIFILPYLVRHFDGGTLGHPWFNVPKRLEILPQWYFFPIFQILHIVPKTVVVIGQ